MKCVDVHEKAITEQHVHSFLPWPAAGVRVDACHWTWACLFSDGLFFFKFLSLRLTLFKKKVVLLSTFVAAHVMVCSWLSVVRAILFKRGILFYCNHTNFRTWFNFVCFVLLAESTKFSSIRKPFTCTSVSDTTVAVRKFLAYESWQTLEYEIFTRTEISAITVQCIQKFFSQTLFDFKRMVSHSISPKFSGKIPYVLSKPQICFLGPKDKTVLCQTGLSRSGKRTQKSEFWP